VRALVIDDSRAMRRIVSSILINLGYEVRDAGHGREGLDVLDWRSMTIMMVTSESEHTQIVKALAAGAHEYVIKPFTADAIRDKLALLGLLPTEVAL
jgi:two-component system chemotaxis response regulator CheY